MEWDLSPLYASCEDTALLDDISFAEKEVKSLLEWIESLPMNTDLSSDIHQAIERLSVAYLPLIKAHTFISLVLSTNAQNEKATALRGRLDKLTNVDMGSLNSAMVRLVGSALDLDSMIERDPYLKQHSFMLQELRAQANHLMDPAAERWILRMQTTGGVTWHNLRNLLDATHLVPIVFDRKHNSIPLSQARSLAYDTDPDIRKKAYKAELAAYAAIEKPMAAAICAIKGEANVIAEAKKYDSVLDMTLDETRMDRATLDALLEAIQESLPDFRRYLKAKAKLLGHRNGLPFYDLFAPIASDAVTYTMEEARAYLKEAFAEFSAEVADFMDQAFENRWIDMYPREGKGGGAFCSGMPALKHSWILTNFTGSFSDISTLAHELGHAFHSHCLMDAPILQSDYTMPLAETASIFNETVLSRYAQAHANPDQVFALLESSLMESTQVIVDIYSRYLFETAVVEQSKQGPMTAAQLKEAMIQAQLASYGDGLNPNDLHPYMWACKTHYYFIGRHFYNFPYAFGHLFGLGVYAQYEEQGEAFIPKYKQLLAYTANAKIADVAASVGINVRDVSFWRSSLQVIKQQIDDFCTRAEK